jgi:D-alanyl-D-alanine carboxypeptidase
MKETFKKIPAPFKAFIFSLLAVFLMVFLQKVGFGRSSVIVSPERQQRDIFESVKPKLEVTPTTFKLETNQTLLPQVYADEGGDYQGANAYGVIDLDTGQVLLSKNLTQRLPQASLTKVMTAVVALDLASLNEEFSVSEKAANEIPTRLALTPGNKLKLYEALDALLLVSANDTATVIKEGIDKKYGSEVFIAAMNEKAKFLGLKNTHFQNPQGFDGDSHYSSVEDLAVLTQYALTNYPVISEIVKKDHSELLPDNNHPKYEWLNNWNGLIGVYPGAYGVKIGNTDNAGTTTIVASQRGGHRLVAILLKAPGVLERDLWTSELLDKGFSQFGISPANITEAELRAKYKTWKYATE